MLHPVEVPSLECWWSRMERVPAHARSRCGSFWWKDIIKLFRKFKEFASFDPCSGASISLWSDNWSGHSLKLSLPHLFAFTRKRNCSLQFFVDNDLSRSFFLPLSGQALDNSLNSSNLLIKESGIKVRKIDGTIAGPVFFSKKAYNIFKEIRQPW